MKRINMWISEEGYSLLRTASAMSGKRIAEGLEDAIRLYAERVESDRHRTQAQKLFEQVEEELKKKPLSGE